MPVDVPATWANAPDAVSEPLYDAADLRRADAALVTGRGVALGARGGIVPHDTTSLAVSVDGADLVTVQPGAAIIPGDAVDGTGIYRAALPAAHAETLTARHATWSRIDLVVFRMLDIDVVGTHTARTGRVEVIAGTASSSPAVPAQPSMSVELARVTVPISGGGAATVDSTFAEYTAAAGGLLLVPTSARFPADCSPGMLGRAMDTGLLWEFTASEVWAPLTLRGSVSSGALTADVDKIVAVAFTAPFATVPVVVSGLAELNPSSNTPIAIPRDITTTGFNMIFRRIGASAAITAHWHAIA